MNFLCSSKEIDSPFNLTKHKSHNNWFIYLDHAWTKNENYFFKGISSSWCKIYFEPTIRIETNKLRDFPIFYNTDSVTNFIKLDKQVPVDGIVEIDSAIRISYQQNFYPKITNERQSFKECHDLLYDAVIENIGTFASNNKKPLYVPEHGGIDTLTVRSVLDFLNVDYETFDILKQKPALSTLGDSLQKDHWGFKQIPQVKDSVIATGFYGDEWILRNPYYVHAILSLRNVNIVDEFDHLGDCYMQRWWLDHYRDKCSAKLNTTIETLISQICNDFQIWHLDDTFFLSPLKHISLLTLLSADTDTIIGQVTNATLSKSIIEKCNPNLLEKIDLVKNITDPEYFQNEYYS